MIKTAEELKQQAQKISLHCWIIRSCSMCDYPLGYYFENNYEDVVFDSGCDCVNYGPHIEKRSWEELAENYNLNQPERNPKISKQYLEEVNKIWKFKK